MSNSNKKVALSVKNLCIDYVYEKSANRVVNGLTFDVYDNELTVILGASGCGKTSTLNALGGMLKPTEGSIMWQDLDVTKMTEKQLTKYRRDVVGFVFQNYNLIHGLTAEENVGVSASLAENPMQVSKALEIVGLQSKSKNYPWQLSGGEQQLVCIARALVKNAKVLLCDEPTGALDSNNAEKIFSFLVSLVKEQGLPVVMITHNTEYAKYADHCIIMQNGKIIKEEFND